MRGRTLAGALVVMLGFGILSGCAGSGQRVDYGEGSYAISGTMQKTNLEGGCWVFVADDGTRFEISGAGVDRLFEDGLHADLVVKDMPDANSICMVGKVLRLVAIVSTRP